MRSLRCMSPRVIPHHLTPYTTGVTWLREGKLFSTVPSPFPFLEKGTEAPAQVQQGLSVHLIQQRRGVPGDGHGRALDHGAGGRARRQPLLLFPPFSLLLLQPLLGHLPPVDRGVTVGPAMTRAEVRWAPGRPSLPSSPRVPCRKVQGYPTIGWFHKCK